MRIAAVLLLAATAIQTAPAMAACACGPDFCTDDPRTDALLAKKKAVLAREYPVRLVALLYRGPQCVARVTRSPDIFTILVVQNNNAKETVPWSAENQKNVTVKVKAGELSRFWIYNARRAFSCCGEPSYDKMSDYDREDDVNASRAIRCDKDKPC
ncbi:hypothetical protein ABS772_23480 [Methylorubrum podarium]|uniref:Secreted protein n=1 Tax=Methylorubrum podarium TaxID=200476 RepID=A0ABV1QTY4_9HYPH